MVHLVDVLALSPEAIRLVDEDDVLVLVIYHFGDVVQVCVLQQDEDCHHVSGVGWSREQTLTTVVEVHVVVVITVPHSLEAPSRSVLELLWDGPPVEVFARPAERWHAVSCVSLEQVEPWCEAESAGNRGFPETGPFDDSVILVNGLALLKAERGVWVHRWCLDEWLELVTWMSWGSLNTQNALYWLFSQDGVAKPVSHMWELLVVTPLDFVRATLVVIVVTSRWSILELFLVVELLCLGEPGPGWLSPPVVVLKVDVFELWIALCGVLELVEFLRDVALGIEVVWSDLRDVHINQVRVVRVNVQHLVLIVAVDVDGVLHIEDLMWQDDLWVAVLVSGGLEVVKLQIPLILLLVDLEEEVFPRDDLVVGLSGESLLRNLVLELDSLDLLLNDLVDFLLEFPLNVTGS